MTCTCLVLVAGTYAWGAWRQRVALNLSETAGGQAPYLEEASRIADSGIIRYLGDRNRMPAIPALLSLFYCDDAVAFFSRCKAVAIVTSVVALGALAWLFVGGLPPAPGVLAVSVTAFTVFLPKASFVQAELLYYTLFFAAWLGMCRLLYRPNGGTALATGIAAGLSYWIKASTPPLVLAFLFASGVRAAVCRRRCSTGRRRGVHERSPGAVLFSAATVGLTFLVVILPYLVDNKQRFGHFFYNVNSTFFLWCDSWGEAKAFADQYHAAERYPDAPPEEIPSASRYFKTHSLADAGARLSYGFNTLGRLFWRARYSRYILVLGAVCALLAWRHRTRAGELTRDDVIVVAFTLLVIAGYLAAFAWYAVVAFGDRFILSLFLPVLFAERFFISQTGTRLIRWRPFGLSLKLSDAVAIILTAVAMVQGIRSAANPRGLADDAFVRFYFNESREAQLAGNLAIATRGYQGVVKLDPSFAAAHHELGLIALRAGRPEQALWACREAVRLSPEDANFLNSLGSALLQTKQIDNAISTLRRATTLNPTFVSALYNLGGAYATIGRADEAEEIARRLEPLDARAAAKVRALASSGPEADANDH